MRLGIDYVALCVIGAAMILGQVRQIPARVRYFVMAAAFAIVAVYRLQHGAVGFNLGIVAVCAVFCLGYVVKGLRHANPG